MKDSLLFLADGFEEMEAICTIDILRRAGMNLKTVAIAADGKATGAHGVTVKADISIAEADTSDIDWLIFPGGMPGAENLYNTPALLEALKAHAASRGNIAAICASPAVVLAQAGLLAGRKATCYPGFEDILGKEVHQDSKVVVDDNIITANGPGNSMAFALAIVAKACGQETADSVAHDLLLAPCK